MTSLFKRYGIIEMITMILFVIRTKLLYRDARIIRFPIDIRGKKYIRVGKGFTTGRYCRIEAYPQQVNKPILIFGNNVQLNDFVHITAMKSVVIEDNVLMAGKIYISDCSHGFYEGDTNDSNPLSIPIERVYKTSSVLIKEKAWIGESVSILPGVIVGKGSIIGANSVVTKSIPDYCIAVGAPAKVIKQFNFNTQKWEKVS